MAEWENVNQGVDGEAQGDADVLACLLAAAEAGEAIARANAPKGDGTNPAPTLTAGHFSETDGDNTAYFGVREEEVNGYNVPALITFGTSSIEPNDWLRDAAEQVAGQFG